MSWPNKQVSDAGFTWRQKAPSVYALEGCLTVDTAHAVLKQSLPVLASGRSLAIDLAAITKSDVAAIALLIEWLRQAHLAGTDVVFRGLPPQLQQQAAIIRAEKLLSSSSPVSDDAS